MVYCNSLEPAELPSRSKPVETPGEFGSIATQPHAAGFLTKLCAVPRGTGCSWWAESSVLSTAASHYTQVPFLPPVTTHRLVEDILKSS